MDKNRPVLRQWKILEILSGKPEGVLVEELSHQLGISTRTVRRDMLMLQGTFNLQEENGPHGKKRWKFNVPGGENGTRLAYDEAAALYLCRQFMEPLIGTCFWKAVNSGLGKIRRSLGPQAVFFFERVCSTLHCTRIGWSDYTEKSEIFDCLLLGLEEQRSVVLQYRSNRATESTRYAIDPYQFLYHHGTIYLIGFSHKAKELRHWKLNRIENAEVTSHKFTLLPGFSEEKYTREMFGVYRGEKGRSQTVKILFDASVARYVQEHRWNASQKFTTLSNGDVLMTLQLTGTDELIPWVMGFGASAEILSPAFLREKIANDLQKTVSRYQKKRPHEA
ncbi:MAG: WYL domain-containing transcriptional regulator [Planctomycetia bacterium]|nr:WYL domain-containing transcriptional regulator [Planctomycetia bacterium]